MTISNFIIYWCFYWCSFSAPILSIGLLAGEPATRSRLPSHVSLAGRWQTFNDATGKAQSIVNIQEEDGTVSGTIERLLDPDPRYPIPRCVRCTGELKDKPIIGMRILWDLKRNGDEWSGGKVLDPDNGKSYNCKIILEDDGKRLKIRGYVRFSLLGRTQYWLRVQ
jgi:uncharacterized protein (DUF2147 family)